jgi:hypothetical protein
MKGALCGFQIHLVDEGVEQGWPPCSYDCEPGHEPADPSSDKTLT